MDKFSNIEASNFLVDVKVITETMKGTENIESYEQLTQYINKNYLILPKKSNFKLIKAKGAEILGKELINFDMKNTGNKIIENRYQFESYNNQIIALINEGYIEGEKNKLRPFFVKKFSMLVDHISSMKISGTTGIDSKIESLTLDDIQGIPFSRIEKLLINGEKIVFEAKDIGIFTLSTSDLGRDISQKEQFIFKANEIEIKQLNKTRSNQKVIKIEGGASTIEKTGNQILLKDTKGNKVGNILGKDAAILNNETGDIIKILNNQLYKGNVNDQQASQALLSENFYQDHYEFYQVFTDLTKRFVIVSMDIKESPYIAIFNTRNGFQKPVALFQESSKIIGIDSHNDLITADQGAIIRIDMDMNSLEKITTINPYVGESIENLHVYENFPGKQWSDIRLFFDPVVKLFQGSKAQDQTKLLKAPTQKALEGPDHNEIAQKVKNHLGLGKAVNFDEINNFYEQFLNSITEIYDGDISIASMAQAKEELQLEVIEKILSKHKDYLTELQGRLHNLESEFDGIEAVSYIKKLHETKNEFEKVEDRFNDINKLETYNFEPSSLRDKISKQLMIVGSLFDSHLETIMHHCSNNKKNARDSLIFLISESKIFLKPQTKTDKKFSDLLTKFVGGYIDKQKIDENDDRGYKSKGFSHVITYPKN